MRALTQIWFEPEHQPDDANKVAFELRPLDMPTFWKLQSHMRPDGSIEWEGAVAAIEHCLANWRGLPQAFSSDAKREFLRDFSVSSFLWIKDITRELYAKALVPEEQRKNS